LQSSKLEGSYLSAVLDCNVTGDDFLRKYICDVAVSVLHVKNFASERAGAIKELGNEADYMITEFITKTKGDNDVITWLNCGTETEYSEIIRRVGASDLTLDVSSVYPLLSDYLTTDWNYPSDTLTKYFHEYKKLKIKNTITKKSADKAFELSKPSGFEKRDKILREYSVDENTSLLVVDGMGAEYYPLILSLANRRSMNIEFHGIAEANLPTSTEFNNIKWDAKRRLESVHGVDNISHDGAHKHELNSAESNMVATLEVFVGTEGIFNRVAKGLIDYERVILTSDHGSSILSVVARKNDLAEDISIDGEVLTGRYTIQPPNAERPKEIEAHYRTEDNTNYWLVRGYNRLKKQGKPCVHGGSTPEERLVPIVVFSRGSITHVAQVEDEQLIEKDGFDI
jgi:hypothetical protein